MKPLIVGYCVASKLSGIRPEDIRKMDVVNIAFALVKDGEIYTDHLPDMAFLSGYRKINPEIRFVISVGGWGAGGFSEAAATLASRRRFAVTAVDYVEKAGLDGIDIDWEYPCCSEGGIASSPADKENFTLYLKALREELDSRPGRRRLLTIAAGADRYFVDSTEMEKAAKVLDYVQLMTYDMRGGFQCLSGHHTNLYNSTGDIFRASADTTARMFEEAGVPREKLILGSGFYSRRWSHVPDQNHGFLQLASAETPEGTVFYNGAYGPEYGELAEKYIGKNGYTRYWDDEAKAPWLFDGENFISYEDERSIAEKTAYIQKRGLSGLMFWEYSCDETGTLLDAIYRGFNN